MWGQAGAARCTQGSKHLCTVYAHGSNHPSLPWTVGWGNPVCTRGSPWWAEPQTPHRPSSQSLLAAPSSEDQTVRDRLPAPASPSLALQTALFLSTFIVPLWGWSPLSRSTLWYQLPVAFGVAIHRHIWIPTAFEWTQSPLRRTLGGWGVVRRELLSGSTCLTSMGLNSTLHPISEFGGGGLNLIVCQFVDWIFYNKKKK